MTSKNIPLNGWPQLKDLEAVQTILNRLDKIEAWKRTVMEETFTGDEITIPNALALPARSLKTVINAIQDLHGYDHPWAGGAEKNKFPLNLATIKAKNVGGTWTGNIYAYNGGTVEIVTDNGGNITAIKLNGTFNVRTDIVLFTQTVLPSGQYKLNGVNNDGAAKWNLRIDRDDVQTQDNIAVVDGSPSLNDVTFTAPSTVVRGAIRIYAGSTTNIIIFPMIRVSTDTDPTFAPYSNICPIYGRTEVTITVEGE